MPSFHTSHRITGCSPTNSAAITTINIISHIIIISVAFAAGQPFCVLCLLLLGELHALEVEPEDGLLVLGSASWWALTLSASARPAEGAGGLLLQQPGAQARVVEHVLCESGRQRTRHELQATAPAPDRQECAAAAG